MVESQPSKLLVAGPIPVSRSIFHSSPYNRAAGHRHGATHANEAPPLSAVPPDTSTPQPRAMSRIR